MALEKKNLRYFYWVILEFIKKHGRLILLSFFISLITVIGFLSLAPYLKTIFTRYEVIGIVGNYEIKNPPDEILSKISNGMVTMTEKGEVIPVIVNSWESRNNGYEYRFHLKEHLLWNDNKALVAEDLMDQYRNIADIKTKVIDDKTIDFFLDTKNSKPLAIFPIYLNRPIIRYPMIGVAGLYKVGKTKLKENNYLKELSLIPNVKNLLPIKYKFYNNEAQLVNAYKKGEINKMQVTKKSIADVFDTWKNSKVIKSVDYSREMMIFINHNNKLLSDKNIKDGLSIAIDYGKIAQYGELAKTSIPPNSWAYNENIKSSVYDESNAKKIISNQFEATSSAKMELLTYYEYYDLGDEIVNYFKAAGLPIDLKIISYDKPDNYDMYLTFLKIPTDPDQYYFWHSTQTGIGKGNISNYKNPKVDLLLEKGRQTIDIQEREANYSELQKVFADNPPAIFLYYPYVYTIERK